MKITCSRGFTLIELMIVVAVIGILAAVAYPSYTDSVRKSRRSDGLAALMNGQLLQEKYRANNPTYGTAAQIGLSANSPDGYYAMTVTGTPTATAFTITATGQNGQNQDTGCTAITVNQAGTFSPADCAKR
jgi:type IV pilus assembly protein PilE